MEEINENHNLASAKEEAIIMTIFGSVVANTWVEVVKDLYRKTINPLTKNGKPKTTPFEHKLKCYIESTGNFLNYIGWKWEDSNSYNNISDLTDVTIKICRLPQEKKLEIYEIVDKYYKEIYGESKNSESNS